MIPFVTALAIWSALSGPINTPTACNSPRHEGITMPRMPGSGRTAPPRSVQFGSHVSVQVNVDANGNNILGDAANEPSIAVDPTNPDRIAIVWRQFDTVNSDFRQGGYGYSTDAGRHWTFPGVIDPGVARSDPVLAVGPNGEFYWASLRVDDFAIRLYQSLDQGRSWGILADTPFDADKPWVAADRTNGIGRGNIYVTFNSSGFGRSSDAGATWVGQGIGPTGCEYGTTAIGKNGEVLVSGFDIHDYPEIHKSLDAMDPESSPTFSIHRPVPLGGLAFAGGQNYGGLDGQLWVSVDPSNSSHSGHVYCLASVVPRFEYNTFVGFAKSIDGGLTWEGPTRINDDPPDNYNDHWFGTMSVAPDGRIDVIWNDTRNSASCPCGGSCWCSELYYSASFDGGLTWTPNEQLSPTWDSWLGWPANQFKIGDYYHMISDNAGANLAYAATFNGEQDIWFLRIGDYLCQGLVAEQPASPSVCAGSGVSLQTSATPRGGSITYQWRKDGANLTDTGSMIGTESPTLVILHAALSDNGYYECLVRLEGCGADMTETARLIVFPSGSADGNNNGTVDARDIQPFIDAITNFAPVSAQLCAYDLTGEGIVNLDDLPPFVNRLLAQF